jgi:hypothetical protein
MAQFEGLPARSEVNVDMNRFPAFALLAWTRSQRRRRSIEVRNHANGVWRLEMNDALSLLICLKDRRDAQ